MFHKSAPILLSPSPHIAIHNNLVSETMAEFYVAGAHPWAPSVLFSTVPPGPPPLPHAFSPEEVTRMLLDHDATIRGIHEELALLRVLLRGGLPPPRASLPASSAAALLMSSTAPFAMETMEKMFTRQVFAAVRLQAAVCGFLARRRLQKAHKQMWDREAALAVVAFAFDAEGCDLDSLDGQLCQSADVSKGVHGVFPVDGILQLYGDGGRGGVFLLVASGDALPSASTFHLRPPRGRLRWSSSGLLLGGCAPTPLSFRWSPWDPGGRTHGTSSCGWCLPSGSHTIKSRGLF
jgi:hypothetical protein